MMNFKDKKTVQPAMLTFAADLPNICSLIGLLSALMAIYLTILGHFQIAVIGLIWAVVFDWGDGIIARRMKGRTAEQKEFGAQLDSLIDMISFGIGPAIFLLSYGHYSPWFIPGAFIIVAVSAIRLSYFNVFGLVNKNTYLGLALDNNILILALVFLFQSFFNEWMFSVILYSLFMLLAILNIAPIKTPKLAGKWVYVLIIYSLILTLIYLWQFFN
jgi:archaetidylserine synthase